jgi:hypothetical protein
MEVVKVEEQYIKSLNAGKTIQNICPLDSHMLMLMDKRGHSVYCV